jgi:signal transduction histidine kinase
MPKPIAVLIVDDSDDDATLLIRELRRAEYEPTYRRVQTGQDLQQALASRRWDAVLCDYSMPGFNAIDAFRQVSDSGLDLPFLLVSGVIGEERLAECMRLGMHDLVLKDRLARLVPALERELGEAARRKDQRRTREELKASQELLARTENLRALGQMAAGIAHDLKNMLAPLSLGLDVVKRKLARGDLTDVEAAVDDLRQVVARGLEVLRRLRDFSRQSPEVSPETVDLNRVVQDAIDMTKSYRAPDARDTVSIEQQLGSPPPIILGHAGELVSAVVNLILNAVDAMPDGGTVRISTASERDGASLVVQDNGPGMTEETQRRLFQPLFSTKGIHGTGLGLAMVYAAVMRDAGSISVDTAPGKGARFTLWFPSAGRSHLGAGAEGKVRPNSGTAS